MKRALVTGAASEIGRAIAERLPADGWEVHAVDVADGELATRDGNRAVVEAALERFGRLDAVVAGAGFRYVAPVGEFLEGRRSPAAAAFLLGPGGRSVTGRRFSWIRAARRARPSRE
jgi:3-hydroxybutyrate dehydrogenase